MINEWDDIEGDSIARIIEEELGDIDQLLPISPSKLMESTDDDLEKALGITIPKKRKVTKKELFAPYIGRVNSLIDDAFDQLLAQYLPTRPKSTRRILKELAEDWLLKKGGTVREIEESDYNPLDNPYVIVAMAAVNFFANRQLPHEFARDVCQYAFNCLCFGYRRLPGLSESIVTEETFDEIMRRYIGNRGKEFICNSEEFLALMSEFTSKYGSINNVSTAFYCYAFRRLIQHEEDPPDFFGKSYQELWNRLESQPEDNSSLSQAKDFVYDQMTELNNAFFSHIRKGEIAQVLSDKKTDAYYRLKDYVDKVIGEQESKQ